MRRIYLRLAGVLTLVVLMALAATAYLSHHAFERALVPEMAKKVASGGGSARSLVLRAMSLNIGFRELYGVDQTFDDLKASVPEISYVAVADAQGAILYQRFTAPAGAAEYFRQPSVVAATATAEMTHTATRVGDQYVVSMPIVAGQQPIGMLHIGIGVDFVDKIVLEMLYDVLVVLVVALFFTLELLHFMAGSKLEAALKSLGDTIERGAIGDFAATPKPVRETAFDNVLKLLEGVRARVNSAFARLVHDIEAGRRGPAHERPPGLQAAHEGVQVLSSRYRFGVADAADRPDEGHLTKVRAPLFIFILAEELTRPFLPGYIKGLLVPMPWLSPDIAVGLPIVLFMLIVALGQPFLGAYSERVGNRHAMMVGAGIAAVGFVATAFAGNVLDLLVWRSLCALGYAMVFVAAQAHVLQYASTTNRARSFALFVGAIMVATVCGPSIGGILADNIGERPTFGLSALLALGSMMAMRLLPGPAASDAMRVASRPPTLREIGTLLVNKHFMTVTGLAAMPAKILLTGVCFYLVPLYVVSIGSSQSVVGRMLMTYAVAMVVLSPLAAAFANTRERMEWLVGAGLLISGLGGLLLLAGGSNGWVFATVFLIGLGQSLSIAAQSALVREHCDAEVAAMGEPAVYGVYRLLERLGNAIGPLLAGVLVLVFGYRASFVATGALVLLCGLCFLLATRRAPTPALVAV
ncbi:MAG: MFS transporter [Burkholderiaceae bacterium]|nr:MFS transporter [Burkholderiaceae bacterium]